MLEVALQHHLVSRLSSLVAVDVTPSRRPDEALTSSAVPTNLPQGWDFEKLMGREAPRPVLANRELLAKLAVAGAPSPPIPRALVSSYRRRTLEPRRSSCSARCSSCSASRS